MSTSGVARAVDPPPAVIEEDAQGNRFALRRIDCPTCGPGPTKTVGMRGGVYQRYGLGIASTVVRCQICSLHFPNPFPFPLDPQVLYGDPESYFARHPEPDRIVEYRAVVRGIIERSAIARPSLLDVGSGRGDLLVAAGMEGLTDTVGLEFSLAMIDHARREHGITLLQTTLEDYVHATARKFDAVVLNAVVEHVYDPDALIRNVASMLAPGGIAYVDTPRDPNLLTWIGNAQSRLRGRPSVFNLSPTWPPFHVFGFTPRSLRILLDKHGLRIESLRVHNDPLVPSRDDARDRLRSLAATQILRLGNLTSTGSNMVVWARREAGA